ncbi:hypothetical protein AJ88_05010 [Mesorhizobium amorphae CCBAU 01583]|nr:hypothetical protein AJ88_05010 [Mesorhizobium amorphae CCBAU 01583]
MEGDIVVGAFAHQLLDLRDMLGCEVGTQRDGDVAVLQRDDHRIFRIGGEGRNGCGHKTGEHDEERGELFQLHGLLR